MSGDRPEYHAEGLDERGIYGGRAYPPRTFVPQGTGEFGAAVARLLRRRHDSKYSTKAYEADLRLLLERMERFESLAIEAGYGESDREKQP